MKRESKQFEPFVFSTLGVGAMLLILVAVYVISGVAKVRLDFTQEKLYTLSPGTKAILAKLDTPVEIRFYCTQDTKEMPVPLKTYAQRVEDLLNELKKLAGDKIEIKKFDPKPDTDAEDSARLDGLEGQMVGLNDKIYLGLAVSQLDAKAAIPFLSPEREKLLEYDLARAITRVANTAKPVVGVMTPLPVMGEFNPMMMRMGQMQRQEPWVFVSELKRDFEVKQVEMTVEEIPSDVKVLVVVHPKGITEKAQYAIDQFLLKGGKLVAFLDPFSLVDSRNTPPGMNQFQAASQSGSTLDKLLKGWGVEFDQNKVVADMNFITRINRNGRSESAPAFLTMTQEGLNTDDVVTSQID
ncbi:MAG: GldG family protein, partial [Verrucomicrobia bacterium]|nr:GldG family protein [Verrucomicrobiota bacterium]